jgi:phosphate transport system substrate-binding protein
MDQWSVQLSQEGVNLNYSIADSLIGLQEFDQQELDFAGSDFTFQAGGASLPPFPFQYVPDVAYSEALVYNLTGYDGEQITSLQLNAETIGEIFTGEINTWDAPQISALNPSLAGQLPSSKIYAVYPSEPSGDSFLLSGYLKAQDHEQFAAYLEAISASIHSMPSVQWPVPQSGDPAGYPGWSEGTMDGEAGPDNAEAFVKSEDGAIAFVPDIYWEQSDDPAASVENAGGTAVQPTAQNTTKALKETRLNKDLSANLTKVFDDSDPGAYPISGYDYMVVACDPTQAKAENPPTECSDYNNRNSTGSAATGRQLGKFIEYIVCKGQQTAGRLGYAYLPKNLVKDAFAAIGRIYGAKQPAPPTSANCPDPY